MASFGAAARSVFRSSSARNAAARLAPQAKAAPSPFGGSSRIPLSNSIFRCPVEASFCVESMLPHHTATASALMTSMLSISRHSYVWVLEAIPLSSRMNSWKYVLPTPMCFLTRKIKVLTSFPSSATAW